MTCGISIWDFTPLFALSFVLAIFLMWLQYKFHKIEKIIGELNKDKNAGTTNKS